MGLPSQQRFAIQELSAENERRQRGEAAMDPARVAFFMERLVGPPVEGHGLIARGNRKMVCECGQWTLWSWSSFRRGRLDAGVALRHHEHRNPKEDSP